MRNSLVRLLAVHGARRINFAWRLVSQKFFLNQNNIATTLLRESRKTHAITLRNFHQLERNEAVIEKLCLATSYVFGARVEGDFAEFGTQTGRSATALATVLNLHSLKYGGGRKLWLFDSFEGLPRSGSKIDASSPHVQSGLWAEGRCKGLDADTFTSLMGRYLPVEDFRVVKGWFIDSVSMALGSKFSLIHIDCDLYESTFSVLHYFFRHGLVSQGAIILFDDWFCNYGDPKFGEQKAFDEICREFSIVYSSAGIYGSLQNSFIIHSYVSEGR